jgi:hypothetical protein
MKKKLVTALGLALMAVFSSSAGAAITLTDFGNSGAGSFTVDIFSTSFGTSPQAASSIVLGGAEGNQLTGGFDEVSILGESGVLRVLGSTTAAPASQFTITLYDNAFNTALYTGGAWSQLNTGGTTLTFLSQSGGFNFGRVIGLDLNTASAGSPNPIGATLTRLETIPEPSRMVLLGLGVVGLGMRRRRVGI